MNTFPYAKAIALMSLDPDSYYSAVTQRGSFKAKGYDLIDILSHEDTILSFSKEITA